MASSVAGATLSVTQTVTLWTVFLPSMTEIKRETPGRNPDFADDVRYAEMLSAIASLGVTLLVCRIEKSREPLMAWAVVTGLLFVAYEVTLRNAPSATTPLASVSSINTGA